MSIRNAMLGAAHQASAAKQAGRMGTISAYNPNTYCVKVFMQPSGVETGWLPIKTPWVGNSWGMQAGPSIGDQVTVSFQEGDRDGGVVLGSIYNNSYQPMVVPSGELWIQHKSGSFLKFLNNGDVQVVTSRDLLATVGRDMTATVANNANLAVVGTITSSAAQWNHTGPVYINGTLSVKYQITGTGGFGVLTTYGNVGGYAAQITGNVNAISGTLTGSSWGINLTGADIVADTYSLKLHHHNAPSGGGNTGPAIP
jgi:phage baseplate assembly protein V